MLLPAARAGVTVVMVLKGVELVRVGLKWCKIVLEVELWWA